MENTKSYKIKFVILFVAFLMMIISAVFFINTGKANAEEGSGLELDKYMVEESGDYYAIIGRKYTFSLKSGWGIDANGNTDIWVSNEDNANDVIFYGDDGATATFKVVKSGETDEDYTVTLKDIKNDEEAPTFIGDKESEDYKTFISDLNKNLKKDEHYVALGNSVTIPSFKDLVKDNLNIFDDLKYTIYYKTPNSTSWGTTTSSSITLTTAGNYIFFAIFEDVNGNALEKKDFVDDDDVIQNEWKDFVFTFHIEDDAPLSVSASKQESGKLNTEYIASAFKIESTNANTTYTLYYSANREDFDNNAKEITAISKISEDYEAEEGEFTYDELKAFNYNGTLTFTPTKAGFYQIKCTLASKNSVRTDSATTELIEVSEQTTQIRVHTHWISNNVASVVFLGVGTLCLIGILVLLFIKPKEEVETNDEE